MFTSPANKKETARTSLLTEYEQAEAKSYQNFIKFPLVKMLLSMWRNIGLLTALVVSVVGSYTDAVSSVVAWAFSPITSLFGKAKTAIPLRE